MKARALVVLEAVFLGLGVLVLSPSANPTAVSEVSIPSNTAALQTSNSRAQLGPNSEPKPLAVWDCISSWYGEDFDGLPTATGETYDMYAATAANPTLPLGSIVRVVNPKNHRSEVVRINDRGPYVEGRELDVSWAVARDLGFDQRGTARVRVELLKVPPRPASEHRN
jgi:rare lipoprotein A (peptidoglycan hydrolase)